MSAPASDAAPVYLETSIIIASLRKPVLSHQIQEKYKHELQGRFRVTGTYSLLEFNNVILKHAKLLYDNMSRFKEFRGVKEFTDRVLGARPTRLRAQIAMLLNYCEYKMEKNFGSSSLNMSYKEMEKAKVTYAHSILGRLLDHWPKHWKGQIDGDVTGVNCAWARIVKKIRKSSEPLVCECSRLNIKCNVVNFVSSYENELLKVQGLIQKLTGDEKTDELIRLSEAIDRFRKDRDGIAEYSNKGGRLPGRVVYGCLAFADLLHVLESVGCNADKVFSMNPREFKVLCSCLDKDLLIQNFRTDDEVFKVGG